MKYIYIYIFFCIYFKRQESMADNGKDSGRPIIEYRVQLEKRIEINKSFSERRNQAVAMRILSYGLFGQKRYQNLYLTCSLNCFHLALKIANQIHQRVAGLAMIIKFDSVQVLEYFAKEFNGKYFEEKKYSKIVIKLTKNPTEEDKKQAGFIPGLQSDQVEEPLTEVLARKKRDPRSRPNKHSQNTQRDQRDKQKNHQKSQLYKEKDAPPKKQYRQSKAEQPKPKNQSKNTSKSTTASTIRYKQKPQFNQKQKRNLNKDKGRGARKPRGRYDDEDD